MFVLYFCQIVAELYGKLGEERTMKNRDMIKVTRDRDCNPTRRLTLPPSLNYFKGIALMDGAEIRKGGIYHGI